MHKPVTYIGISISLLALILAGAAGGCSAMALNEGLHLPMHGIEIDVYDADFGPGLFRGLGHMRLAPTRQGSQRGRSQPRPSQQCRPHLSAASSQAATRSSR